VTDLVSKQVGAVFTILGGAFYIIGALLGTFVFALFGAIASFSNTSGISTAGVADAVAAVFLFGVFTGVLIIVGGVLLNSDSSGRRKSGGILAIAMMVIGAAPTLGGLLIGFVFTLVGTVVGLTYKGEPDLIIGMRPMPPQASVGGSTSRQSLNYCIKCGSPLHTGSVYCGVCGAEVPQS
jgi:hypothetical protein